MNRVVLVMIARDDARHIDRALRSAKGQVDEMVVLDLGSRDATARFAREAGARVVPSRWSEDPSAVWNHALAEAGGDWHVLLESHEWLDAGAGSLAGLRELDPGMVGLAEVIRAQPARELPASALEPRILPGQVRFTGRFRPEPVYPGLRTWRTSVLIAADADRMCPWTQDRAVFGSVVAQALAVQPGDPRLLAERGCWQRAQGDLDGAAASFARAAEEAGPGSPERHRYVIEALDSLRAAGRFTDALALAGGEIAAWNDSPDFAYVLGDLFFGIMLGDPARAPQVAPLAESCWRRALTLGDRDELPGAMRGRGSFLAAQALALLSLTLGRAGAAQEWRERAEELRVRPLRAARPRPV